MDLSFYEDSSASSVNVRSSSNSCSCDINIALFIPGVCIVALAIIDMIVLYAVPTIIAHNNKKKLPDAHFESPNKAIIAFHFLEHIFLMALGIILIIMSIFDFGTSFMVWGPVVAGVLFLVSYIVLLVLGSKTRSYTSQLTVEQMRQAISQDHPIEYFYVYRKGNVRDENCHYDSDGYRKCTTNHYTCYSKNGVKFPVNSERKTAPYNFTDVPNMFYFNLYEDLRIDTDAYACLNGLMNQISGCPTGQFGSNWVDAQTTYDKYPLSDGTFIVSGKKIPAPMTKASRICSMLFGATAFYEIYTKSIPFIDYTMSIDINSQTGNTCQVYNINCGNNWKCSRNNNKPTP